MRKNIAGMSVILLCCVLIGGCSDPVVPAGTLLNNAAEKAAAGDWAEADRLARQAIKQDKNNADALMLLALAENSLDSRNEAVEYSIQAARLKPDHFLPHYIQGMLLSKNGKPDLALRSLKEARRFRPDDVNTLILLAENSIAVRRFREAAGYFKLLAREPSYKTSPYLWNGLGICYTESAPQMALKLFKMAERYAPNDPVTMLNLAVLHDRYLRKEPDARRYYEHFVRTAMGKAEYDAIRGKVEFRLDSMKER